MGVNNTEIDANQLVEEIFAIPSAVENANKDVAEARTPFENQKAYVKYLRGQKWIAYKTGVIPIEGIPKPTDKAVDMAVDSDPDVLEATKKIFALQEDYSVVDAYAGGIEAKKRNLAEAVKLSMAGWFSGLKITNTEEITNFANTASEISEREAMREKRRERSTKR